MMAQIHRQKTKRVQKTEKQEKEKERKIEFRISMLICILTHVKKSSRQGIMAVWWNKLNFSTVLSFFLVCFKAPLWSFYAFLLLWDLDIFLAESETQWLGNIPAFFCFIFLILHWNEIKDLHVRGWRYSWWERIVWSGGRLIDLIC